MVRRDRVGNRHAVTFRSAVDGRVMFVLPWGDFTYVGTTDTDYRGSPAEVRAEPEDVRYLLDSGQRDLPRGAAHGGGRGQHLGGRAAAAGARRAGPT
jgi:glycerol-3-phosphate dehydrogenase